MPGAFRLPGGLGGGPYYDPEDEEDEEEQANEEQDEDSENENSEDEDEENENGEDEGDDEDSESEESKQEKQKKERKTKRKLQSFSDKIKQRFIPLPTKEEAEALKEGKKNKNLKEKAREAENKLKEAWANFWQTKVYPNLGWISAVLGIVFVLFIIICVVIACKNEKYPEDGTSSSLFGVKGDKFYGVRAVYGDEDKAVVELLDEYYMTISESVTEVQKITTMPNASDPANPCTIEITVATSLLAEDFSFANFDEEAFKTENAQVYDLIKQIADKVYEVDKEEGATAPTNVIDTLKAIKYFGFNEQLNTDIKTLISDYVKSNYTFIVEDDATISKAEIDAKIDTTINSVFDSAKYKNRTEKLFVKDFVFTNDDAYMKGAEAKDADFTDFSVELLHNGQNISLTSVKNTIHGADVEAYLYNSANNLNLAVEEYNYTTLPEAEMSILGLAGNSAYSNLLNVDEETKVSTWNYNQNALMAKIENGSKTPFLFSEEETKYA